MVNAYSDKLPPLTDSAPFIIIGSGIAGLYTALELSKIGRVILITKSALSESNTTYAQGGIACARGINDSPELHYQDTIMAGAGLCNPEAVLTLVYEGLDRVKQLIDLEVPFDRDQGKISLTREAAHSRRRILHADGDATGRAISQTLIKHVQQSGIQIYEDHFALALITQNERCQGIITFNHQQELNYFLGSTIILCTGGLGQLYGKTTNPTIATGDGMMLAWNAGAELRDLEFIQFHPTALFLPPAPSFLISETVRGEGALLLNAAGERFMPKYHPLAELAPRDIVARSIFSEIQKDGSNCVFLDLSMLEPSLIKSRFPNISATCLQYGLDITKEPIPVTPAAHYSMGGIYTDLSGRTTVPGLFAAGEVAATGVHGANRLASNSLLEGLVFGGRIVDYLKTQSVANPSLDGNAKICYPTVTLKSTNPDEGLDFLHQINDRFLGIIRDKAGLQEVIKLLNSQQQLGRTQEPSPDFEPSHFELQNMYSLAKLIAQAALRRTESRGGHFRSDFPTTSQKWRKHISFHYSTIEVLK